MLMRCDRRGVADLALVVGLILAVTLPFLDRPFHLDDNQFIRIARNILRDPWRPFAGPTSPLYTEGLTGDELALMERGVYTFQTWVHPPLQPYVIALVVRLSGGLRERPQHLAYLFFTLLAGVSAYLLARRFTEAPRGAALCLIVSPVFIISAHSVMSEMPMLAFYHMAVLTYVYGIDRDNRGWLVASGVCVGLTMLTRYTAVTVLPVLAAYGLLRGARPGPVLLPFGVAALLFGAWEWQNYQQFHEMHSLSTTTVAARLAGHGTGAAALSVLPRTIAFLVHVGGVMIFPLHLLLAFLRGRRRGLLYAALAGLTLLGLRLNPAGLFEGYTPGQLLLLAFLFTSGLFTAGCVLGMGLAPFLSGGVGSVRRSADRVMLCVWFLSVLGGSIVGLPFSAARYLLPLALPLVLLVFNAARDAWGGGPRFKWFAASAVVLTGLLGLNMAYVDYAQARVYKAFTEHFAQSFPDRQRVWFVGEFGFRLYMEDLGCFYLPEEDKRPTEGDLLVHAREAIIHYASDDVMSRARLLRSESYAVETPLRINDGGARAGYYSHGWGLLPYYFSRQAAERFDIFRVSAPRVKGAEKPGGQ